ncbi:MAG: hypothetical protein S4CHLAM81_14560 [Chlamydiales bacterium]|nr:hypothetical protein [Chlamydiales bacterium]MCH9636228.1 hypothetical protein [Chlamydiales bacterium]MCH9703835.1 SufD family Fe-S cluster assembly protein [Chlamydiota bacterium]
MTGLAERALDKFTPPTRRDELFRYVKLPSFDDELSSGSFEVEGEALAMSLEQAEMTFGAQLQVRQERWLAQEQDPYALYNGAHAKEGLFLYVSPGKKEKVTIKHSGEAATLLPRLLVHVGRGASLKLMVEQKGERANRFFDFLLEENAHVEVQFSSLADEQFDAIRATCKQDSSFKTVTVQQKTPFLRQDYAVSLNGENASCSLFGLSRHAKQAHTNVLITHAAENTLSSQKFKAVVDEGERASFEGKIYVERHAQKTQAYQLSQSLLLSPDAKAYSKPNLEIFADDVKASHGATVGQIDPEEIFYLQSRGISKESAKALLIEGFVQEILNELS